MENTHKNIYLKIRAEQIKMQHDSINKNIFRGGYPLDVAYQLASQQLDMDLKNGKIRITIDELLTLDDDNAINLIEQRMEVMYN